ncbi:MAG: hypothetical protein K8H89_13120 [Flavobacteriales bacterium]|nr:hypothetical protein [Flavobacteriales bacterium]
MSTVITPTQWPYPGARWWKCDLHNHTPASLDYGKGVNQAALRARSHKEWLLDYMRAGLDCVAITDHNTGAWIDPLKRALAELDHEKPEGYRPVTLLPGVELSIERLHALVLFGPEHGGKVIDEVLGFARFDGTPGNCDDVCKASLTDIANEVARKGGLFIPAHVDGPRGLFTEYTGNALNPALRIDSIVGMEFLASVPTLPEAYKQAKLNWTMVVGSDAHHPDDQGGPASNYPGSRWTWIKMGQPTIDGLRLALLDGPLSVCRSVEPGPAHHFNTTPEQLIEELEINGTKVMGNGHPVQLKLSPWLNAIIGDRGTGKSSFVHFARQALGRNTAQDLGGEDSQPWKTFNSFMRQSAPRKGGVLKPDSSVKLRYALNGTSFLITTKGALKDHVVEEVQADGSLAPANSQDVRDRFKVTIVSQDQLTDLIQNGREGLLRLVDEAIGKARWTAEHGQQFTAFMTASAQLRELAIQLGQADRLKAQQEDIGRKLAQFDGSDHANVLKNFQRQSRQTREVRSLAGEVEALRGELRELQEHMRLSDVAEGIFDPANAEEQSALNAIRTLRQIVHSTKQRLGEMEQLLGRANQEFEAMLANTGWKVVAERARKAHEELIARLRATGVTDPEQYGQLVQQRHVVDEQLKRLQELRATLSRSAAHRKGLLQQLMDQRMELTRDRNTFLNTVLKDNNFVRMKLLAFGEDKERLIDQLRAALDLGGDGFADDLKVMADRLYKDLPEGVDARQVEFNQRLAQLKQDLTELAHGGGDATPWTGWLTNRLKKAASDRPEYLDRLDAWFPEDSITVEYNASQAGAAEWRDVNEASAGQRSAALLAFLLSYGNEPIILDQPEDDLDNQVVFDLVVQGVRLNKQRRQIVVITHDANVVVNGDAEAVHVMEYRSGQCWLKHTESLQNTNLRDEVCRIMEGGRNAFKRRYQRLIESAA